MKTYHEQIQIKDGSTGNSYEKLFKRFFDDTVTSITIEDPYIRIFHQVIDLHVIHSSTNSLFYSLDRQFLTFLWSSNQILTKFETNRFSHKFRTGKLSLLALVLFREFSSIRMNKQNKLRSVNWINLKNIYSIDSPLI